MSTSKKIVAIIGATGNQGGSVVRALQAGGEFQVRALTRNPSKHQGIADEVVEADLSRPETLEYAFEDAYGVFAVTNFWENGTDELAQGSAAVNAAKTAGVQHFVWSTLPNVQKISDGKFDVPHFTDKAKVDELVGDAGFAYHSFVVAPFFFQNLNSTLAPQTQQDGSKGWTMPIDPTVKAIHMGDITELGNVVAGAFAHPARAGWGQYLQDYGDGILNNRKRLISGYIHGPVYPHRRSFWRGWLALQCRRRPSSLFRLNQHPKQVSRPVLARPVRFRGHG